MSPAIDPPYASIRRSRNARGSGSRARLALLLLAALLARPAVADTEETEHRLKTAGVEPELRRRIHAAIGRGAQFLIRRQREDGSFDYGGDGLAAHETGTTALCALALAHSAGPAATEAARTGLHFRAPDEDRARPTAVQTTYAAGLTAMLVHALRGRPRTAEHIVRNLCDGQDPSSGWWGYGPGGLAGVAAGGPFSLLATRDFVNLSTSQYGALGLWAGGRSSGRVPHAAWRRHLAGLCASQQRDGSWSYAPRRGATGYPNGTFMGLANLVLARQALAEDLEDDPVLAAQSAVALRAGRRALDRDAPAALSDAGIDYYGWYALEKACVFLDLESPGGIRWYVVGAERLLADQTENGGWGGSRSFRAGTGMTTRRIAGDEVSTAFALLFLLRASETYHPTTPRDVNAPGPTTPGGGPAAPGEPGNSATRAPPTPPPVRLAQAQEAVERLARAIGVPDRADDRDDVRIGDGLAAIDTIRRALRIVEPDLPAADATFADPLAAEEAFVAAVDAWRVRAGAALVEALSARSSRLALAAAEALSVAPRSTSGALRTRLDGILRGGTGASRPLVESAFRAVAAQSDPRSLVWLVGQVSSGRATKDVRCTRAALLALAEWQASSALERRAAALRVARELQPLERSASAADPDSAASWADHEHWLRIGPPALRAVDHLCRDPEANEGAAPWGDAGAPTSVSAFREWLEDARRR